MAVLEALSSITRRTCSVVRFGHSGSCGSIRTMPSFELKPWCWIWDSTAY
jgi:hypothetical protein